jgi:polysaccharide pyruvyl transferase CsaB
MINRILIFGYFGCGNPGDETNLSQLVDWIREIDPQIQLTVISAKPAQTAQNYRVAAVYKFNFFSVIGAIRRADLVIGGGGSLFQDLSSLRSLFYYAALVFIARIFKLTVFLYGQGVGPIRSAPGKQIARWAISQVQVITIRDQLSEHVLADLKVSGPKIYLTADPLLLKESLPDDEVRQFWDDFAQSRNKTGLIIQKYRFIGRDFWHQLLDSLKLKGLEPYLIPMQERDLDFHQELAGRFGLKVFPIQNSWKRLQQIIGGLDLVISARLHGLVAAVVQGIPCIGLAVDPKIEGFCLQYGIDYVSLASKTWPLSFSNQIMTHLQQSVLKMKPYPPQPAWKERALENQLILRKVIRGEL